MNRFWQPPPASCFCVHAIRRCVLAFFPLWCAAAGADGFDVSGTDPDAVPVVPAGFVATMPAREPLVRNVSMLVFDTRGRLFVAMGPQYRHPGDNTPGDAIVMLVDADGDGLADEYVRIATGLGTLEHALDTIAFAPDGFAYIGKADTPVFGNTPRAFRDLAQVEAGVGAADDPEPVAFTRAEWPAAWRASYRIPTDGHTGGGILRCDARGKNLAIVCRGCRNPWGMAFDNSFDWLATDKDDVGGDRFLMPFMGAHFGMRHRWNNSWTGEGTLASVPACGPIMEGSGTGVVFHDSPMFPETHRNVFYRADWLRGTVEIFRRQWQGALLMPAGDHVEPFITLGDKQPLFRPTGMAVGPDGALWIGGWGSTYGWNGDKTDGRVFWIAADDPAGDAFCTRLAERTDAASETNRIQAVRILAHRVAGRAADVRRLPPCVIASLADPAPRVRFAALLAAANVTDRAAVLATIKRLDNRHVDYRLRLALLRKLEGKQIDGSVRAGLEQMCVNAWSGKLLACLAAIDPASWQAAPDARGRAEKLLLAAAADSDPRLLDRVPAVASSLGVPTPKLAEPHPLAKAADVAALLGAADPARGAKLFADARQVAAAP